MQNFSLLLIFPRYIFTFSYLTVIFLEPISFITTRFLTLTFQDKNIKLIIKVFTKQYVSESLPRSLHGKVLHLSCLSILCEQLHSQLECVGVGDEGVKMAAGDQNFFVSTVSVVCCSLVRYESFCAFCRCKCHQCRCTQ